jgi:hypothetical protein
MDAIIASGGKSPANQRNELDETDLGASPDDNLLVEVLCLMLIDQEEKAIALEGLEGQRKLRVPIDLARRPKAVAI